MQLVSGTCYNIQHSSDGSCSISIAASGDLPNGSGWGPKWGEASAWVWLTHISRQANFLTTRVERADLDEVYIYYNLDKNVNSLSVSINNEEWYGVVPVWGDWSKEATIVIENLRPNTSYNFRFKANVNGVDTYSEYLYTTTLDIAKFTNLTDFFFGDSVNIAKRNDSNHYNFLTIKIGDIDIVNRQSLNGNNLMFSFTQEQLDKIYKNMSSFTENIEFILHTTKNQKNWDFSQKVFCTMNGNAKSIHYFIADRNSKRAKMFYFDKDRESKKAIFIIKKNGKWRWCV